MDRDALTKPLLDAMKPILEQSFKLAKMFVNESTTYTVKSVTVTKPLIASCTIINKVKKCNSVRVRVKISSPGVLVKKHLYASFDLDEDYIQPIKIGTSLMALHHAKICSIRTL